MSCSIHDRCTCYAAPLHYTTSLTTATGSSQVVPQTNNVGYVWAAPLVPTSATCQSYPFESVLIQPPTLHSARNTQGTMPLYNSYHSETHVHERHWQQELPSSREQFATQHPYPSPSIQGVSRMTIPSNHPEMLVHAHRNSPPSGFGDYNGFATQHPYFSPSIQGVSRMTIPTGSNHPEMLVQAHRNSPPSGFGDYDNWHSIINLDQSIAFNEPPHSYWNNSLPASPAGDAFSQSALLPNTGDRPLSMGQIALSTLPPMPLHHSSLYQVLKQDPPPSPLPQPAASSIAHALELQVPLSHMPVLGNAWGSTVGTSETALSAGQASLAVVAVDPCYTLPHGHTLAISAEAQSPGLPATPPCASQNNGPVVITLSRSPPEQDCDTLPRLHELSNPLAPPKICHTRLILRKSPRLIQPSPSLPESAEEDQSAASSPLSPVSSRPPSSMGAPASSSQDIRSSLESTLALPLLRRKRPVLRAKLACLFCRQRKIQCCPARPFVGDHLESTCQQCAKRRRNCEYPEISWRGRLKKWSRDDSDDEA